jgi:hypothetical protein
MRKLDIARQHKPNGAVFTTMDDLRDRAAHLWAEAIKLWG